MEKFLVNVEFRYNEAPKDETRSTSKTKNVTLGICESFEDACICGNLFLENLESKFKIHKFPDGRNAAKERFSKNGGPFGSKNTLVSDLAYIQTPFSFFAKITTLKFTDQNEAINEVLNSVASYQKYNK